MAWPARAAGRLKRVLKPHGGVPPVQYEFGTGQHFTLQPPQHGITVVQHGRRCVCRYAQCCKRLPEGLGRSRLTIPDKGEAVLDASGTDDLARDHLEVALLLGMSVAHVAAIQPDMTGPAARASGRIAAADWGGCTTSSPTRRVQFRTVPAFAAPPTGSSSNKSAATLLNGASAAYRAAT
ncbi:hypothetical protein JMJ55_25390 [Belnapia sp. T6]|uniref:Uncharacterized protein n=1 Tax=Belnapia mucosa TaxID=2804532 RepID=A0ABS1VAK8_9PROT|nr:hypothetical protein [Belnapia mucosa]MBL6458675.1 hypothetical protein [Belnapia mucosa]